ncbi:MAG: glycoside hydrolase family 38 C-terminal domain-containing protein, partial [Candidatus Freyarchaeota archaeon]
EYGGAHRVGYQPDCFGQIAQTPQIMKGFGFDGFVFWRGLGDEVDTLPTAFLWESPSGDRILTYQLALGYFNAGDLPEDLDDAVKLIEKTKAWLEERSNRSFHLLLNGHDHAYPQEHIPQVIRAYNERHPSEPIRQGSLADFFDQLKENVEDLPVHRGEFRWRWLLKNHPHDSICGCSVDQVHREMETRFAWSEQIADFRTRRAMEQIASRASASGDGFPVAVFNPSPWRRTGVVEFFLDPFPLFTFSCQHFDLNPLLLKSVEFTPDRNFCVVDREGRVLPVEVYHNPEDYRFRADENIPPYTLRFLAENVPACGYKVVHLRDGKAENVQTPLKVNSRDGTMENEHLRVRFNPNGTVDVTEISSGVTFKGLHVFEDVGDNGDEYNYSKLREDTVFTSENLNAEISFEEHPMLATAVIRIEMLLPEGLDEGNRNRRSSGMKPLRIVSRVSLFPGSRFLYFKTEIENSVKDHRLRVLFPTGIKTNRVYADGHFGVVERSLELPDDTNWIEVQSTASHQNLFVDINDGKKGLAIANKGLPEYEIYGEQERTIAITLIRSVGWLSRNTDNNNRRTFGGPAIPTPEAQCQGRHTVEYAVIPCRGEEFD